VCGQGSDSPEAARVGSSPGVSAAAFIAVSGARHVDGRDAPGVAGHAATARPAAGALAFALVVGQSGKGRGCRGDVSAAPGDAVRVPLASDRAAARGRWRPAGLAAGPRLGWESCWARMEVGGPLRVEVFFPLNFSLIQI
jgi:hypothetical protein